MTELNPFRSAPEAHEAPEGVEQGQTEQPNGKRNLVIALGGVAGLILAGGGFFFLSGGDAAEEFEPVKRAPRAEAAAPAAAPQAKKLPAPSRLALGRNPFRALYVEPAPAPPAPPAPADPGAAGDGVTTPLIISTPVGGGAAPDSAAGGGAGAPAPQQPTAKEHKLVLLRVFGEGKDQSASFSIDGKQQTAKVGTTFGPSAEILLLSLQQGPKDDQWTAVLQVGDGDPFDVVTGEPVVVR